MSGLGYVSYRARRGWIAVARWLVIGLGLWCEAGRVAAAEPGASENVVFYREKVEPILKTHCFKCHGDRAAKGGLRLTSQENVRRGGESGPAVDASDANQSLLLEAINYQGLEMPPGGKLPVEQIDLLTNWVRQGLPGLPEKNQPSQDVPAGSPTVNETTRRHWSFQPVVRPDVPSVRDQSDWVKNPLDAFLLARMQEHGLTPAAPAAKVALLRRAYYNLTGLPPEPRDVAEFLADDSATAFERVVDRLLDSPHYGERWARHWLDLVRYAETNSYERDGAKPFAWRYRDYVIRSFNADRPYDQFLREQLAGDELDEVTADSIIATGYYRLGLWQDEPVDPEQELFEDLDDLVRTTSEAFLGLTVGCARCHEHKLDPIPQRDYYRMLACFRNVRRFGERSLESVLDASVRSIDDPETTRRHQQAVALHRQRVEENRAELAAFDQRIRATLVGVEVDEWKTEAARLEIARQRVPMQLSADEFARYATLTKQRDDLRAFQAPGLAQALCVKEHGRTPPPTFVLVRGSAHAPGEEVQPGLFAVLGDPPLQLRELPPGIESSGRRRALADWIASPANPLTARVIVNRVWQHHFGRGLVRTPNDFGLAGERPTHPELLDWLAAEFVDSGWQFKRLHKLIMLSSAYQTSSRPSPAALERDPGNDWFSHGNMRRLEAEELRDSILAVNGSLNRSAMYGPSIYVTIPDEILAGQSRPGEGWGQSPPDQQARRTIYVHVKRSLVAPLIASFDGPDTDASCPVRFSTTQPTQALSLLNSRFVQEQADVFANFLRDQAGGDQAGGGPAHDGPAGSDEQARVELAWRRVCQRPATEAEIAAGCELLHSLRETDRLSPELAWRQFCVVMLNLNEFVYLD